MSVMTRNLSGRAAWLWIGGVIVVLVLAAVAFADLSGGAMRAAAEWQSQLDRSVRRLLHSIGDDGGSAALWTLVVTGFLYGVVHTLGPGHGKAVVVAYFLDGQRKHAWVDGILAGSWIAVTHTAAALVLAGVLALMGRVGAFSAQGQVRSVELVSFGLIFAVGLWRLHAGLTGRLHAHDHGDGHDHGHHHGHGHADGHHHAHDQHHAHGHHHDHAGKHAATQPTAWRRFFRLDASLGLLTAAGVAPCAGAVVMVLFASAFGVLWAGLVGVLAIAIGMAGTLAAVGIASMAAHRVLVGDRASNTIGRVTTILAALIVVATSGSLLVVALYRLFTR
jgi:nickel/cobalt transporter (NicO) family protein